MNALRDQNHGVDGHHEDDGGRSRGGEGTDTQRPDTHRRSRSGARTARRRARAEAAPRRTTQATRRPATQTRRGRTLRADPRRLESLIRVRCGNSGADSDSRALCPLPRCSSSSWRFLAVRCLMEAATGHKQRAVSALCCYSSSSPAGSCCAELTLRSGDSSVPCRWGANVSDLRRACSPRLSTSRKNSNNALTISVGAVKHEIHSVEMT